MKVKSLKTPAQLLFFTLLGFGLMFYFEETSSAYLQQVDLKTYLPDGIRQATQPQKINKPEPVICQAQPVDQTSILDKQARAENACLFIGCGGFF